LRTKLPNRITEDIRQYVNHFDVGNQVSTKQRRDGTYREELLNDVRKVVDYGSSYYFTNVLRDMNFSVCKKSLPILAKEAGKLHAKYQDSLRDINYKKESLTQLLTAPADKEYANIHLAEIENFDTEQLYSNLEDAKKNQILYQIRESAIEYKLKKKTATSVVLESLNDYFSR